MQEYTPYVLSKPAELRSSEYLAFLDRTVFTAGLLLFYYRHQRRPDFPYPDTKFNPNTGEDLPESSYEMLLGWVLGRGGEAFARHLEIIDELEGIPSSAKDIFQGFVDACSSAILQAIERNSGRCPFLMNRRFQAIDVRGRPIELDETIREPADLFCAKALLKSGDPKAVRVGKELLRQFIQAGFCFKYRSESVAEDSDFHSASWTMLAFGAIPLVLDSCESDEEAVEWAKRTAEMLKFVFERHYDPATAVYYEFVSTDASGRRPYLNPGHVSELVGLGLQAIDAIKTRYIALPSEVKQVFQTAWREFPRLLLRTFALGYNHVHQGLYQAIHSHTGEVLNDQMPWWNLPETMRAAVRAARVAEAQDTKADLLQVAITASNAYFSNYINPRLMFFPFRTRSGITGRVVDIMPVVPEADPLYHTNLALMDMKDVLQDLEV